MIGPVRGGKDNDEESTEFCGLRHCGGCDAVLRGASPALGMAMSKAAVPAAWRAPNWSHGHDDYAYYDSDDKPECRDTAGTQTGVVSG